MDLDPEARRILELARDARTPAQSDKARVEQRLAIALGVGAGGVTTAASHAAASSSSAGAGQASAAAATKSAGSAFAIKSAIAGAVIATAIGGYLVLREPEVSQPRARSAAPAAIAKPAPEPEASADAQGEGAQALAESDSARAKRRGGAPAAPLDPAELELLHRAQTAWRAHDAETALTLATQHRKLYPRSTLRLEREGLQVLALCELDRKGEAAPLAERLLKRAPRSPLRAAIEESCGLK